ncbi:RNA-directed DNA polymerase, eukaryota, partial [Tanacetum coccineum]
AVKADANTHSDVKDSKLALVLDDSCFNESDFTLSLVGKLKEFNSLPNLKKLLVEEGFSDISISYMGGFWESLQFLSKASKENFMSHILKAFLFVYGLIILFPESLLFGAHCCMTKMRAHLTSIGSVCASKLPLKRLSLIPSKSLSKARFFFIRAKELKGWAPNYSDTDDASDSDDESVDSKLVDTHKEVHLENECESEAIPEIVFEESARVETKSSASKEVINESPRDHSKDPCNIYDMLNKKNPDKPVVQQSEGDPKYPPGFTPSGDVNQECINPDKEKDAMASYKEDANASSCSGHFHSVKSPKTGGSMLQVIEDLIKVGQTMGYKMEGCMKDIEETETKMKQVDLFSIRACWGNLTFDSVFSPSVGNSCGILCVWDSNMFHKENSTVSDYFIAIMDVIVMGDFNEVRYEDERYGSNFNARGAAAFNSFISTGGLVEVPSGGYSFTWSHKSSSEMSRLDRFLGFDDLQRTCPNLSSLTLDRYLSDHRPILLRELNINYGPTPFRFSTTGLSLKLAKKLKILKGHIRLWVKGKKDNATNLRKELKNKLAAIDTLIDKGVTSSTPLEDRMDIMNNLTSLDNMESIELALKAKVEWSIEGDKNSKKFHGIINKRRNNLVICGIIIDGDWIEDPITVKKEFLSHFQSRFEAPCANRLTLDMDFPNRLSPDQAQDLERVFHKEEIKEAVWDCGLDKSPGPDGFTFGFYRRFWTLLDGDVVEAVNHFFNNGFCHSGGNSSFIVLILKFQGAKMVKDYRPISLIGNLYKIFTKLLDNRLVTVIDGLVNEVQSAFIANRQILDGPFILNEIIHWCKAKKKQTLIFKVDFEKAFDSVRWDFLDDILKKFGFGSRWRNWIQSCLKSSKGSILVNGSPTSEF